VTSLACRRLRPALVDLAVGSLAADEARRVEAHIAGCDACRADLAAMRGLSSELRDPSLAEPPEDFFRRQRQAIMRRVRTTPVPGRVRVSMRGWQLAGAVATVVLAVFVARARFTHKAPRAPHAIEHLDDDALTHLDDLLPALVSASTADDADGDILAVHDLPDDAIDSLAELDGPES
jgi:anti-sigma factor RsiW